MLSRSQALALMQEYTASDSLRKHMLAVEGAMRAYAERFGEDVEEWGLAGLLHDFDYERWPNEAHSPDTEHPAEGVRILRGLGVGEPVLQAILGHARYSGVPRESLNHQPLISTDEEPILRISIASSGGKSVWVSTSLMMTPFIRT